MYGVRDFYFPPKAREVYKRVCVSVCWWIDGFLGDIVLVIFGVVGLTMGPQRQVSFANCSFVSIFPGLVLAVGAH